MTFDFSNIKAKGKLGGFSSFSAVPAEGACIQEIPLELIDSFNNHPFSVVDNDDMAQLAASVRQNGIMNPAIVRVKPGGRYELISGHRRKRACELAGLATLKAEVRELSDEDAVIIMVDSNLQREKILASEKAFAYQMKYEAMKKQVGRPSAEKLPPAATASAGRTDELVGEIFGESKDTVRRYIRLTYLINPLLDMVDSERLSVRAAVELSYIPPTKQAIIAPCVQRYSDNITAAKAAEIREWTECGGLLDDEALYSLFTDKPIKKSNDKKPLTAIKFKQLKSYIPNTVLKEDYEDYIIRALMYYRDNANA